MATMVHNRGENTAALFDSTLNKEYEVPTSTTDLASTVGLFLSRSHFIASYTSYLLQLAMFVRSEVRFDSVTCTPYKATVTFSTGSEETETLETLVIILAITICTYVGPVCVRTLFRQVKKVL